MVAHLYEVTFWLALIVFILLAWGFAGRWAASLSPLSGCCVEVALACRFGHRL